MASTPQTSGPRGAEYFRLILLGALIGIPAALLAAGFLALVHEVEDWLWTDLPDALGRDTPPWYIVVAFPAVGGVIVWLARRFLPGDGGHPPLNGIATTPTPWRYAPSVALAAFGTLAFGAVLGPEAPLIALGSVVGMFVVDTARVRGPQETAVLATAGSFSAVSALFGGPLVAGILLMEAGVGLGAALVPALLPGLVAAAVGYVLFVGLGSWGGLDRTALTVPGLPLYETTRVLDLLFAIVVGVLTAVLIRVVRQGAVKVLAWSKGRMAIALVAGGAAVGLLAELARLLGANSQDVLFSGQSGIPDLVLQDSPRILLITLAAKAIGYAISLGSGFRGGPVFPSIFTGVAVAMFATIWFNSSPTWAVAVGTAAGMTAGTNLVIAALLFSGLIVGTNGLNTVPAAVLAAVSAWLTNRVLGPVPPQAPARAPAGGPSAPAADPPPTA
jgi:H+/Cl- antiporter ClcA